MPRGADHRAFDPRDIPRALDLEARHIVAVVIGRDNHAVPNTLERLGLLPDPDMISIIGEEASRRDHQDRVRQNALPSIADCGAKTRFRTDGSRLTESCQAPCLICNLHSAIYNRLCGAL